MAGLEPDKARATAGGKKVAVIREWREPEVSSRDACPSPVEPPGPAVKLIALAKSHGWMGELTYARGETPPSARTEAKLVHSIAVRLTRGTQRAAVCWESPLGGPGKWTVKLRAVACRYTCQSSGAISRGVISMGDRELKAFLAERDPREGVTPGEMERAAQALSTLTLEGVA